MYHGCHKSIETTPSPTFFLLGLGIKKEIVVRKGPPSKQPGAAGRKTERATPDPFRPPETHKKNEQKGPAAKDGQIRLRSKGPRRAIRLAQAAPKQTISKNAKAIDCERETKKPNIIKTGSYTRVGNKNKKATKLRQRRRRNKVRKVGLEVLLLAIARVHRKVVIRTARHLPFSPLHLGPGHHNVLQRQIGKGTHGSTVHVAFPEAGVLQDFTLGIEVLLQLSQALLEPRHERGQDLLTGTDHGSVGVNLRSILGRLDHFDHVSQMQLNILGGIVTN